MARRLLAHVRALSDKPLRWVVNTHYHWDHTAGNGVFREAGATLVSSALTREFMHTRAARQQAFLASRGFEIGPEPCLADETVAGEREIDLGNQRLILKPLGAAETDDALAVHLPQEGCVAAGDTVMTGSFPMFGQPVMDEGLMGTPRWLDTLAAIERLRRSTCSPATARWPTRPNCPSSSASNATSWMKSPTAWRAACRCRPCWPTWRRNCPSGSRRFRSSGAHRATPSCAFTAAWCRARRR